MTKLSKKIKTGALIEGKLHNVYIVIYIFRHVLKNHTPPPKQSLARSVSY